MAEIGILSYGAYLPRRRLQRSAIHAVNAWFAPALKALAQGERCIANWDEDSITMAVEAGRDALSGFARARVTGLSLAASSLPFIGRLNSGVVKEALALPDGMTAFDTTGGQRAATTMLIETLQAAAYAPSHHLCIAAEMRKSRPASEGELTQGDAA